MKFFFGPSFIVAVLEFFTGGSWKPGGIIALLDEACMFPKSNHETFSQKLYQTFKNHKRFIKPKLARSDFEIVHYAGDVVYQSDQFLDKNKDYVVTEHQDLLSASKCSFVAGLFPPSPEETAKPSKFSSIGSRFRLQLQQLMETINSTEPHYIRCVKPNTVLQPAIFENATVMQQLRSGGVLEAVRIKCAGYPTHRTFSEFLARFEILAPEVLEGDYEEKVACEKILEKTGLKGYLIGKSKIFLRGRLMAELDAQRTRIYGAAAATIQKHIRARSVRKMYVAMRRSGIRVQSYWRAECWKSLFNLFNISWALDVEVSNSVTQLLFGLFLSPTMSLLWVNGVKAIISELWFESKQRIFEEKRRLSVECFSLAKFKASQWCALSKLFAHYSPNMIYINWGAFIFPI